MATAKAPTDYKNGKAKATTAESIKATAKDAGDSLKSALDDGRAQVKAHADELADVAKGFEQELSKYADDAKTFVRQNPATSVAIAAGVGLLLGALINGRRS